MKKLIRIAFIAFILLIVYGATNAYLLFFDQTSYEQEAYIGSIDLANINAPFHKLTRYTSIDYKAIIVAIVLAIVIYGTFASLKRKKTA